MTITTLLPLVPASIGHCLQDLFDIFSRLSAFRARQSGTTYIYIKLTAGFEIKKFLIHDCVYQKKPTLWFDYFTSFVALCGEINYILLLKDILNASFLLHRQCTWSVSPSSACCSVHVFSSVVCHVPKQLLGVFKSSVWWIS